MRSEAIPAFSFASKKLAAAAPSGSAVVCAKTLTLVAGPAVAQSEFYQATEAEIARPPGILIRQEPMLSTPEESRNRVDHLRIDRNLHTRHVRVGRDRPSAG